MTDFVTTATVKGVELVKAGTWQGLTGPVTLTREDLADALAASQDPEVDHAALKLGHIDPRFDGQPAAGWVERLRLSDDGQTLLGDLVDMPSKLAAITPGPVQVGAGGKAVPHAAGILVGYAHADAATNTDAAVALSV